MDSLAHLLLELFGHLLGRIIYFLAWLIGWPLERFRRWLDRLPDRDPSQLSALHRLGRLTLGFAACLMILAPLAWLIWR